MARLGAESLLDYHDLIIPLEATSEAIRAFWLGLEADYARTLLAHSLCFITNVRPDIKN